MVEINQRGKTGLRAPLVDRYAAKGGEPLGRGRKGKGIPTPQSLVSGSERARVKSGEETGERKSYFTVAISKGAGRV
jgi:hypothetical protein